MAEAVSLVTFLEGIDLTGAPSCEIWDEDEEAQCSKPAIARVVVDCGTCQKATRPRFVCVDCLEYFRDKAVNHIPCGTLISSWKRV